jgi:hypothetical protein
MALNPSAGLLTFAGVGNVAAVVAGEDKERHTVSTGGILGHEVRTWRQFTYPWTEYSLLVVHTDGIGTRWNLGSYPGLASRSAALTAGVLYRDFARSRDDATVIVLKQRRDG